MSIIIKNEKMPNKCSECPFCGLAGRRMERLLCMFTLKSEVRELIDNRLPECPLVELSENEDAISRQAAIDIFDDYNVSVENGELEAYRRDRKRLCDLPSAQPKIKWTFISEKLPDEGVDVLCKTESGFRTIASYGQLYPNDEEKGWITSEFNRFQTNFFAKWRPLIEDND